MYGELGTQLKNKWFVSRRAKAGDFAQFKRMIFWRTILLALSAILITWMLYTYVFFGRFANFAVSMYQNLFHMNYKEALNLYQHTFRNNIKLFFAVAMALIFFLVFRIYLNWFTRYFMEVNQGIDCIINETAGEISLSPELLPLERKMNAVRHTIEQQKSEMKLAENRKNDLIMYLAHDLKTPLASVTGYLNLLRDEKNISEELREKYLTVTLDKAERLEDLMNEFFEIAKFNLSHITLQYSRISLTRLLEMLLYEFQPMLKEKNLTCSLALEEDFSLQCDADKIQRVFDNLLRNAVIYSFPGTDIRIAAKRQDETASITFSNDGDTIPAQRLGQIFEQFYRLDLSRSTKNGGAGLGLAIAKQIVELHGGKIWADSEHEKTKFTVVLPLETGTQTAAARSS